MACLYGFIRVEGYIQARQWRGQNDSCGAGLQSETSVSFFFSSGFVSFNSEQAKRKQDEKCQ